MYKDLITPDRAITDKEAIDRSLTNIIMTDQGTVPGKPRFGCSIKRFLFETLDHVTAEAMKEVIIEQILTYEKRITLQNVIIQDQQEYNRLAITVQFQYKDSLIKETQYSKIILSL